MGLDVSHGCWNGPYSMFMRWRIWLAEQIGLPLMLMEGFMESIPDDDEIAIADWTKSTDSTNWESRKCISDVVRAAAHGTPIRWILINDPLVKLLDHSDCEGSIKWYDAKPVALRLLQVIRSVPDDFAAPVYTDGPDKGRPIWTRWQDGRGCYDGMVPPCKRFAAGLLAAYKAREDVRFH